MPKKDILSLDLTRDFIKSLGGDDTLKLVELCYRKRKMVTDEEIGKKLKHLKITEIRSLLNRLHYRGIAHYKKTKDTRSGWYSYTWEIKSKRIAEIICEEQTENITKLESKAEFETEHDFFSCNKGCDNVAFEIAAEYQFKCPLCGENMDLVDNEKRLKNINKKINKIKKELSYLQDMLKSK